MNVTGGVLQILDKFSPNIRLHQKPRIRVPLCPKRSFVEQNKNWERPHFLPKESFLSLEETTKMEKETWVLKGGNNSQKLSQLKQEAPKSMNGLQKEHATSTCAPAQVARAKSNGLD